VIAEGYSLVIIMNIPNG